MKKQNLKKLTELSKELIREIGENPNRTGLKDTPRRMARMYLELFKGYDPSQLPKVTVFPNNEDGISYDQIITDRGSYNSMCLSADSQIECIDGTFKIKDIVGQEKYVFSYDESNEKFTVKKAKDIRRTQQKAEIWKLTTDYNTIYATPNHKFLTYNRGWVELQNLNPGDSLVALNRRCDYDGYKIINTSKSNWIREHNFIYQEINQVKIKKGHIVHHKDRNKLNNNIDNLQYLSVQEHGKLHITEYLNSLTEEEKSKIGKNANWGFVNLKNTDPKRYEEVKKRAKNSLKKMYNSEKGKQLKKIKSDKAKIWWKENKNSNKVKERNKKISTKAIGNKNHKVIKTEFYGYEDVYNMEVEETHNFIANNLVVHNCEHHMALFYGTYYFGYIPDKKIIGLSKVARVVDYFSARMQVQERLGENIVKFLTDKVEPRGIILILKGRHTCKETRGVKKAGEMTTSIVRGVFERDASAKQEFLNLINLK